MPKEDRVKNWKCAYCGSTNRVRQEHCGDGEVRGCGATRLQSRLARITRDDFVGSFNGKPVYSGDPRLPDLQMHEDFMIALDFPGDCITAAQIASGSVA
jgi:hypothetical protein